MEISIIILGIIIIMQLIERFLYAKDMNQKLQDCIKAVMSRNMGEFIAATQSHLKTIEQPPENDEIELGQADDKTFNKYIERL